MAEKFNNNWSAEKCPISVQSKFEFFGVTEQRVRRLVKDIKLCKSCAIDGLSTRLVHDAFEVLVPELTYLYNTCLDTGEIPRSWCHGNIT